MVLPAATADHYRQQQRLTAEVVVAARRAWGRLESADFDRRWETVRARLAALLAAGQVAAAQSSDRYVSEVLDELSIEAPASGEVNARAFGVSASDGRPTVSLLDGAMVAAKRGASLDVGRAWLEMAVQTQLADASRGATGVAIAARPDVGGYVRMLNPPSCSRCAVQAGKFFRWNAGFLRHPRCDCRHIPANEDIAGDLTTDPKVYFDSLSEADQDAIFTKSGAQAIRDGADVGQVVNSRRGMFRAGDVRATREGTTTRGFAGRRIGGPTDRTLRPGRSRSATTVTAVRPMPEQIYAEARDREHAIELLQRFGFLA